MLHIPAIARKYLKLAWRQRWPAVLFTWLVCAGGWFLTMTIPNQYEASARLYVDTDALLGQVVRGLAIDNSLPRSSTCCNGPCSAARTWRS